MKLGQKIYECDELCFPLRKISATKILGDVITYAFESRSKWENMGTGLFICGNLIAWKWPGFYLPISPISPTQRSDSLSRRRSYEIVSTAPIHTHTQPTRDRVPTLQLCGVETRKIMQMKRRSVNKKEDFLTH